MVRSQDQEKHAEYCGSKTQPCLTCKRPVQNKNVYIHLNGECERNLQADKAKKEQEEAKYREQKIKEEKIRQGRDNHWNEFFEHDDDEEGSSFGPIQTSTVNRNVAP